MDGLGPINGEGSRRKSDMRISKRNGLLLLTLAVSAVFFAVAACAQATDIPREKTLRLIWGGSGGVGAAGQYTDHEIWNPYNLGTSHQNGALLFYEPLAYYSAFDDKTYPWLAERWEYNGDSTELTIFTRQGVTWSDGTPFSAADVAYTIEYLNDNGDKPSVRWASDVARDVESVAVVDDNTVRVSFVGPRPKFMYFMTYKYDIGIYMVPKHIFDGKDWAEFSHFDIDQGWPVTTGPWRVRATSAEQKVIDRADGWWAVDQGLVSQLPEVERIVYIPNPGEQQMAQSLIANNVDVTLDLRPATIQEVINQNPSIITHSGQEAPYGYVDWWPISLFFNDTQYPFDNRDVRWAISNYIDREDVIATGYGGSGTSYELPLPSYKPLLPYKEVISDLLEEYDTLEFSPEKGDRRLTNAGFTKDPEGIWRDSDGNSIKCDILGFGIFNDIGPVVASQLKAQGIESSYANPPDAGDRQIAGDISCAMRGHGGSVRDPYFTMRLYQSSSQLSQGEHQANFYKWSNPTWDRVTDEAGTTPIEDVERLKELWREGMEVWLPELPDVQLVEWYHRIPMNQTYWTGYPTAQDPYTNGAFWHLTFQLILNNLRSTQ